MNPLAYGESRALDPGEAYQRCMRELQRRDLAAPELPHGTCEAPCRAATSRRSPDATSRPEAPGTPGRLPGAPVRPERNRRAHNCPLHIDNASTPLALPAPP